MFSSALCIAFIYMHHLIASEVLLMMGGGIIYFTDAKEKFNQIVHSMDGKCIWRKASFDGLLNLNGA